MVLFCRFSCVLIFFTEPFPSMVAAGREGPLGNHVDQNLAKRLFNGACIFLHLFFAVTVACLAGVERGGERRKEGIGERRKETPLLVRFVILFFSPPLPSPLLSFFEPSTQAIITY